MHRKMLRLVQVADNLSIGQVLYCLYTVCTYGVCKTAGESSCSLVSVMIKGRGLWGDYKVETGGTLRENVLPTLQTCTVGNQVVNKACIKL